MSAVDGAVAEGELLIAVAGHVTAFGVHEQTVAPEICEFTCTVYMYET